MRQPFLVIDFDSTFVKVEALDELARMALADNPHQATILTNLERLTRRGMEGKLGFAESLDRRLKLFRANRKHIKQLINFLRQNITPSIARNQPFFRGQADRIYIISGGFIDYIWPVVLDFGLKASHVLANRFEYNPEGEIISYDKTRPLAQDNGKVEQIAALSLDGPIHVIGDGYTDYLVKSSGQAEKFYAFTENISRPSVILHADKVLSSFDQIVDHRTKIKDRRPTARSKLRTPVSGEL